MTKNIAVIRGDGIGPEIVQQALRVLDRVAALYGHTFQYTDVDMGGCAIDKWGRPSAAGDAGKVPAVGQRAAGRPWAATSGTTCLPRCALKRACCG